MQMGLKCSICKQFFKPTVKHNVNSHYNWPTTGLNQHHLKDRSVEQLMLFIITLKTNNKLLAWQLIDILSVNYKVEFSIIMIESSNLIAY